MTPSLQLCDVIETSFYYAWNKMLANNLKRVVQRIFGCRMTIEIVVIIYRDRTCQISDNLVDCIHLYRPSQNRNELSLHHLCIEKS